MDRATEVRRRVLEAIERGEIPEGGPSELAAYELLDDGRNSRSSASKSRCAAEGSAVADSLLRAEDVAELIGMRTDFIYRLAREGRIPHLRFGRTVRFRSEAITRWLEEQERGNGRRLR